MRYIIIKLGLGNITHMRKPLSYKEKFEKRELNRTLSPVFKNNLENKSKECVLVSLANIWNCSKEEAKERIMKYSTDGKFNSLKTLFKFFGDHSEFKPVYGYKTVNQFIPSMGRYIVWITGHMTVRDNGRVVDTYRCQNGRVYRAYLDTTSLSNFNIKQWHLNKLLAYLAYTHKTVTMKYGNESRIIDCYEKLPFIIKEIVTLKEKVFFDDFYVIPEEIAVYKSSRSLLSATKECLRQLKLLDICQGVKIK